MKTKYGTKRLKEASKKMDQNRRRMCEIALEFQKADPRTAWGNEYYSFLMDEFVALLKDNDVQQGIINTMIGIEWWLRADLSNGGG